MLGLKWVKHLMGDTVRASAGDKEELEEDGECVAPHRAAPRCATLQPAAAAVLSNAAAAS